MSARFEIVAFANPEELPGVEPRQAAVQIDEFLEGTGLQVVRSYGTGSGYYVVRFREDGGSDE